MPHSLAAEEAGTELVLGAIDPLAEDRGRAAVILCCFGQVAVPVGNDDPSFAGSRCQAW
jgi:hypothetical protein